MGSGKGYSVLEVIHSFEKASGKVLPFKIVERRPGDIAASYADPTLANKELEWVAAKSMDDMCKQFFDLKNTSNSIIIDSIIEMNNFFSYNRR